MIREAPQLKNIRAWDGRACGQEATRTFAEKLRALATSPKGSRTRLHAFTLIELLVVIGIIGVIIAILLPALNKARRSAQNAGCLANLRSIGQAMVMYASENKGWLPGSGWTSGCQFWNTSTVPPTKKTFPNTKCPAINEPNDWIGPLAREMGIIDNAIEGTVNGDRYNAYRNLGWMICPSYRDVSVAAKSASAVDVGPGQGLSYCVTLAFLNRPRSASGPEPISTDDDGSLIPPISSGRTKAIIVLPSGYGPQFAQVANSSEKIFAADGARTDTPSGSPRSDQPPAYNISGNPTDTGWDSTSYADYGAFGGYTHAFSRSAVPGNSTSPITTDGRIWSYRHGALQPFQSAGAYRTNAVFFDGHAETLDDVQAANPALWMPTGSVITPAAGVGGVFVAGATTVWLDVLAKYCPGISPAATSTTWTSP